MLYHSKIEGDTVQLAISDIAFKKKNSLPSTFVHAETAYIVIFDVLPP
jgi:hypothetical protein